MQRGEAKEWESKEEEVEEERVAGVRGGYCVGGTKRASSHGGCPPAHRGYAVALSRWAIPRKGPPRKG